ncbi:universal stress protein [Dyadobacter psychrotolerans]|uniref:Universal stress protein n=1 Tax=Dyadobacter psychrotolerans TaxID=2541721 RepID=A0A4R5E1P5_9BACT|nr:universal stress protein [Dyadobacter psychrotolerans]TDE17985.1 universal stress protein [Dyadobacter psychrotolerans]
MKNILLAINAEKLIISDIDFGCYLAKMSGSRLTGVFLENQLFSETPTLKTVVGIPYVEAIVASDLPDYHEKLTVFDENVRIFNEICTRCGVQHSVHLDKATPMHEIISESRFGDLLIINPAINFDDASDDDYSNFTTDVLANSECPVLVAPVKFEGIDEIVFTYDGGAAEAFAIRQFANIFPELDEEKISVVQVNKQDGSGDEHNLKQYLCMHYTNVSFHQLNGNPNQELFKFLFQRKNALVVIGAYSRSKISRNFFPSAADRLIKSLSIPVFIAHY